MAAKNSTNQTNKAGSNMPSISLSFSDVCYVTSLSQATWKQPTLKPLEILQSILTNPTLPTKYPFLMKLTFTP